MIGSIQYGPLVCIKDLQDKLPVQMMAVAGCCYLKLGLTDMIEVLAIYCMGRTSGYYCGRDSALLTKNYLTDSFSDMRVRNTGQIYGSWIGSAVSVISYMALKGAGASDAGACLVSALASSTSAAILGCLMITSDPRVRSFDIENPRTPVMAYDHLRNGA